MKKFFRSLYFLLLLGLLVPGTLLAQQAKYVFYFIGDGMGLNQVNGTEMYLGELEGKIGINPLCFAGFPVAAVATSFSATHSVTDSAAGGTALATGKKTKNGAIGVDINNQPIYSIAAMAKEAGHRVGVTTSVSVDHATPASFYAHQPYRGMYYEIATDLVVSDFDFYAGSGFLNLTGSADDPKENIFTIFDRSGYTIARGYDDFTKNCAAAQKMIMIQQEGADVSSLPYAIDRKEGDLTLSQITESAIRFLTKEDKGFFLMVEGGKIDWACHDNDAATAFQEVVDMDEAVKIAYDFYLKHPDETLIVVTADHETGGLGLGRGPYELNLKALANQKCSQGAVSSKIKALRQEKNNNVSWEDIRNLLKESMGFWEIVELSETQEQRLKDVYSETFADKDVEMTKSEYASNEPLAAAAKEILNQIAYVGWVSGGHSDAYIPIFAVGAGSELFTGRLDNVDIPKKIAVAAGY